MKNKSKKFVAMFLGIVMLISNMSGLAATTKDLLDRELGISNQTLTDDTTDDTMPKVSLVYMTKNDDGTFTEAPAPTDGSLKVPDGGTSGQWFYVGIKMSNFDHFKAMSTGLSTATIALTYDSQYLTITEPKPSGSGSITTSSTTDYAAAIFRNLQTNANSYANQKTSEYDAEAEANVDYFVYTLESSAPTDAADSTITTDANKSNLKDLQFTINADTKRYSDLSTYAFGSDYLAIMRMRLKANAPDGTPVLGLSQKPTTTLKFGVGSNAMTYTYKTSFQLEKYLLLDDTAVDIFPTMYTVKFYSDSACSDATEITGKTVTGIANNTPIADAGIVMPTDDEYSQILTGTGTNGVDQYFTEWVYKDSTGAEKSFADLTTIGAAAAEPNADFTQGSVIKVYPKYEDAVEVTYNYTPQHGDSPALQTVTKSISPVDPTYVAAAPTVGATGTTGSDFTIDDGYGIEGWYTTAAFQAGTKVTFGDKDTSGVTNFNDENAPVRTLYAKESQFITLTFDKNYHDADAPTTAEVQVTPSTGIPADDIPDWANIRPGYELKGWNTESNGSATPLYTTADLTTTTDFSESDTLYAIWEATEDPVTLNFDANKTGVTANPASIKVKRADTVYDNAIPKLTSPTADNYIFDAWYKGAEANAEKANFTTGYTVDPKNDDGSNADDETVYAHWNYDETQDDAVTVTFMNGTDEYAKVTVKGSTTLGTSMPTDPTKTNAVFKEWNTVEAPTADNQGKVLKSDTTISTLVDSGVKELTVYAQFVDNVTIVYNENNGTANPKVEKVENKLAADTYEDPDIAAWGMSKPDYEFVGWNTKKNGSGEYIKADNVLTYGDVADTIGTSSTQLSAASHVSTFALDDVQLLSSDEADTEVWYQSENQPSLYAAEPFIGSGTEQDPYAIIDEQSLRALAESVDRGNTYEGKFFNLQNDITLTGGQWNSIGSASNPFKGLFHGQYHTISGLTQTSTGGEYGLFGNIGQVGNVTALTVKGTINATEPGAYVGGIVGNADVGSITCCTFEGSITKTAGNYNSAVGGIVGYAVGTDLYGNHNAATITYKNSEYAYIGGIVGEGLSVDCNHCYNTGAINFDNISDLIRAGGIVGFSDRELKIGQSYNTGNITVTNSSCSCDVGGIIGCNLDNTLKYWILDCYNTGNISASGDIGGIAGNAQILTFNNGTMIPKFDNCFNTGTLTSSDSTPGPIVGGYCSAINLSKNYYLVKPKTASTSSADEVQLFSDEAELLSTENDPIGMTAEQFASGEVAYRLNNNSSTGSWRQTIGADGVPSLDDTHDVVYYNAATNSYSNSGTDGSDAKVLYAQWRYVEPNTEPGPDGEINEDPKDNGVKVTFDSNAAGNKTDQTVTEAKPKTLQLKLGDKIGGNANDAAFMPDKPTRTNYVFTGWNTKADGTGTPVNESTEFTADLDGMTKPDDAVEKYEITLYAQWTVDTTIDAADQITVTFNKNINHKGEATDNKEYKIFRGDALGFTPSEPVSNTSVFEGWETGALDNDVYDGYIVTDGNVFDPDAAINDPETYYALWTTTIKPVLHDYNTPGSDVTGKYTYTGSAITPTFDFIYIKPDDTDPTQYTKLSDYGLDIDPSATGSQFEITYTKDSADAEFKDVGIYEYTIDLKADGDLIKDPTIEMEGGDPTELEITTASVKLKVDPTTQQRKANDDNLADGAAITAVIENSDSTETALDISGWTIKYSLWNDAEVAGVKDGIIQPGELTDVDGGVPTDVGTYVITVTPDDNHEIGTVVSSVVDKEVIFYGHETANKIPGYPSLYQEASNSTPETPVYELIKQGTNIYYSVLPNDPKATGITITKAGDPAKGYDLMDDTYETPKQFSPDGVDADGDKKDKYWARVDSDTKDIDVNVTADDYFTVTVDGNPLTNGKVTVSNLKPAIEFDDEGNPVLDENGNIKVNDPTEIKVVVKNDSNDEKEYTIYVQRPASTGAVILNPGNSPYGMIERMGERYYKGQNTPWTKKQILAVKDDLYKTFADRSTMYKFHNTATNDDNETFAAFPDGADADIKYTPSAWGDEANMDKDVNALFIYQYAKFKEPGIYKAVDANGSDIDLQASGTEIAITAENIYRFNDLNALTDVTLEESTELSKDNDGYIADLTANSKKPIRPDIYSLKYTIKRDGEEDIIATRNLILLPKRGDTDFDNVISSADVKTMKEWYQEINQAKLDVFSDRIKNICFYRAYDTDFDEVVSSADTKSDKEIYQEIREEFSTIYKGF